jgi:hypothetical protein
LVSGSRTPTLSAFALLDELVDFVELLLLSLLEPQAATPNDSAHSEVATATTRREFGERFTVLLLL